jgi:hypothetical protein
MRWRESLHVTGAMRGVDVTQALWEQHLDRLAEHALA